MGNKNKKKEWTDTKAFHVSVDMFKVDVVFICNANKEESVKLLKEMCGSNYTKLSKGSFKGWSVETILGRMLQYKGGFVVLLKDSDGNFRTFVSILAHEINHVVCYLLKNRRIPLNEDTEEVYAYLTEYITREALLKLYD